MKITLLFPGKPKAVQSMKVAWAARRTYQPTEVVDWKNYIRLQARQQLPEGFTTLEGVAIGIDVGYEFIPPKSIRSADRRTIEAGGTVWHTKRPDVGDNLNKGLFDALTGIIWKDDALICYVRASKFYSTRDFTTVVVTVLQ